MRGSWKIADELKVTALQICDVHHMK
jgi:hypothetical protein